MPTKVTQNDIVKQLVKAKLIDLEKLIDTVKSYMPDFNEQKFRDVFRFAAEAHHGQMRKQEGVPYIIHPFETAKILASLHADETTLIAALLHDVPEDTQATLEQIEQKFGKKVAYLVQGITKLSKVHYRNDMQKREVESLKNLFIHVGEDPRTMIIKLADRLHNMRTLEYMDVPEKRMRKARETLEIFAPIASLLGIKELQAELEDLCFQNLYPEYYTQLKETVETAKKAHAPLLNEMLAKIEDVLSEKEIDAIVYSQQTNLYPIYKDLTQRDLQIKDYQIKFFVNILVSEESECYETMGIMHSLYRPKPNTFEDYISVPKSNGYQSIHTSVFGSSGVTTTICIRTHQMHFQNQYGITTSYFQNEGKNHQLLTKDPRATWLEEAINIEDLESNQSSYLDDLKKDIFQDRMSVFTPKGKVVSLPLNSTCIDFAYSIHTEVGNRAIRAQVNNQNVSLSHILKKGDLVNIVTTDYAKSPSHEWFTFAKTTFAKKKMKEYFKKESRASKIKIGRQLLQKEYDRAGLGLVTDLSKWKIEKIVSFYNNLEINNFDDVFVHIAEGSIVPLDLINLISAVVSKNSSRHNKIMSDFLSDKLVHFNLKITCEPYTDLANLLEITNSKKDRVILTDSETKFNFITRKLYINTSMFVRSYNDISQICSEFEQIEGVTEVKRVFWHKTVGIIVGSILTFLIWAFHPFLINYLTYDISVEPSIRPFLTNAALYAGIFILFGLIFNLKKYSENNFPEIRESNRIWIITYIISVFVLSTIFLEVYIFNLRFDWILLVGAGAFTLYYLLSQLKLMRATKQKK
ncbi:MAG: RelA/SpoT family protein [Candidatus Altimarinota bacterium]